MFVVAIDGVRLRDVFEGPEKSRAGSDAFPNREALVPELTRIERDGAVLGAPGGSGFYASGPNFVSLPGYMEILSGTSETGCTENDCKTMRRPTLLDEYFAQSGDPSRAGVFASWSPIARAAAGAQGSGVVSAGPHAGVHLDYLSEQPSCSSPLERGRSDVDHHGLRGDDTTAELALGFLRDARPSFVFVSLGSTDEHAHQDDYRGYLEALHRADHWVGRFRAALEDLERSGVDATLLVTTDHGRADHFVDHGRAYPESARSFLFAVGSRVRPVGHLPLSTGSLSDIAPTVRALTGLAERLDPSQGRVLHELFG